MSHISSAAFTDTKPHYELLDGLRGVAALLVVFYHIFEGLSFAAGGTLITTINHGYLAVDFFFILSGFVIGYAYDDRWKRNMTLGNFFTRRLIRLHPMIIMGTIIGAITFCIQGSVQWDGSHVATSAVMLALLAAMFFIPAYPGAGYDVRGNGEMFSLNGPSWSLFFEYIGNILYALFIHRLSNRGLAILVALSGIGLAWFALFDIVGYGMLGVGWTLDGANFWGGMLRMLFPFSLGMLLSRHFRPIKIRGAFWICSAVLLILFCVPYIEGKSPVCLNGVYELICIALVFPALVWIAASGKTTDKQSTRICRFLGDISFPLYAIHYPLMYLFYAWLIKNKLYTFTECWQMAALVYTGSILLAYLCLKCYDEPVRKWLSRKFLSKNK
ncbi:acyltransferase [Phocaeicola sp. KGMB11183]|jgi:peptidoglycan/LPS O-acetylase OafA/YrhL|uniref:Acyltransferase n=1 Tax=Phocaeicola acetigenes TaxID=3016083 RepID=A0ABT4PIT5_9BACT|nr:acyltransferase [Phocaeicola sp. KGMB11183]MCZ8372972.1 acyltransferase [Phocaeicola sp. KGMB11183]